METKFQTSFIPKKPTSSAIGGITTPRRSTGTASIFMTIATIIFVLSIAGAGGMYAWKQYLISNQGTLQQNLAAREKQFNIDLIEQLKAENVKIDLARKIINNHLALSQIFDIIGRLTIENVRFASMDVTTPVNPGDGIKVTMQGIGTSLSAVAYQSDVLSQLDQYNLRKIVKNPILSNPTLGANQTVSFGFSATIDPAALSYVKLVSPASTTSDGTVGVPAAPQGTTPRNPFNN